jgi:GAF domain-containing protein
MASYPKEPLRTLRFPDGAFSASASRGATVETDDDCDFLWLNRAMDRISSKNQMPDIASETLPIANAILKCDACAVYLLEGDHFLMRASWRSGQTAVPRVTRRAVRNVLGNLGMDPLLIPERAYQNLRFRLFNTAFAPSYESFLLIPILVAGQARGLVNAYGRFWHQFTMRQISAVSILSGMISSQIEVVRLSKENISLAARLESCEEVEKATNILARDLNVSHEAAYLLLQQQSRHNRKPMRSLAAAIVLADGIKGTSPSLEGSPLTDNSQSLSQLS